MTDRPNRPTRRPGATRARTRGLSRLLELLRKRDNIGTTFEKRTTLTYKDNIASHTGPRTTSVRFTGDLR